MKRTYLLFCMLFISAIIYGQAQEGVVAYQKNQQRAAIIELPYSPDIVTAAMSDYLSKKGKSKGTDIKGFITYRNTGQVPQDSVNADLYFRVERKSRQEKESSVVSLLLLGKEDDVAGTNVRHLNMEEAKSYLNGLVPAIEAYYLELQIKDQNDAVAKAESKLKGLVNEGEDLEKKRLATEKKIEENKQYQQNQAAYVEAQKQKLANWVSQRKN